MTSRPGERSAHAVGGLRLKHRAEIQTGVTLSGEGDPSDALWPYLRVANVQTGFIDLSEVKYIRVPDASATAATLRRGDVLMTEGGDIDKLGRGAVWSGQVEPMLHQNHVFAVRPGGNLDASFLVYWLEAQVARDYFLTTAKKSTNLASTNKWTVSNLPIPGCPVRLQCAIADYLDRETARIDTLIDQQRRLIEMLQERRSSVVSHAVGNGLDGSVAVKASGLGAVPYVPRHWPVIPLRHALTYQEGPGILATDFRDEGVPLLRVSGVRTSVASLAGCNYLDPGAVARRWAHFKVEMGDLLISASASMGTVSEVVSHDVVGAVPYTGLIRIKPGRMTADFIRWFMVSGEFMHQVENMRTGSTIQHFGPSHLAQMRVALPPQDEQRRIAAYLYEQTAKIDALIVETEKFIELSRERRAALITAAVTGQIDVRGEVA